MQGKEERVTVSARIKRLKARRTTPAKRTGARSRGAVTSDTKEMPLETRPRYYVCESVHRGGAPELASALPPRVDCPSHLTSLYIEGMMQKSPGHKASKKFVYLFSR